MLCQDYEAWAGELELFIGLECLDNQLLAQENPGQRLILIVLAVLTTVAIGVTGYLVLQQTDPYIQTVLALKGDATQGHAIFQMNCAVCHGTGADGKVGPSLIGVSAHKSKMGLIQQVISGQTPPMPQFQPSAQEMADLLIYLQSL